jgi:hypothetical protein
VFGDKPSRCWKQIIYFKPEGAEPVPLPGALTPPTPLLATVVQAEPAPATPSAFGPGQLVQDERGVRLVKGTED